MNIDLRFWILWADVVVIALLTAAGIDSVYPMRVHENGWLETTQLVVLIALFFLWLWNCARLAVIRTDEASGLLAVGLGSAGVALQGACRETTWGKVYGASHGLVVMLEVASYVVFAVLVLAALGVWIFRARRRGAFLKQFFTSRMWGWIFFGLVAFAFADRIEHHTIPSGNPELYEEILELVAYLSVAWAGLRVHLRLTRRGLLGGRRLLD